MRSHPRTRRLPPALAVLLGLVVVCAVLGLVLDGLASTLAWVVVVLAVAYLVGPVFSPRTSTWDGPYRDRRLH